MTEPTTEQAIFERAEVRLREWSATIERIAAELDALALHAEVVADSHLAELKTQLKSAREKLEASRTVTGEGWAEAKGEVEELWGKLRGLIHKYDLPELV